MRVPIYGFDTSIPLRNNRGARGGAMAGRMALQLSGHAQVQVRLKTNCGIVFVGFASPALGGHLWRGLDGECEPPDRIRLRCRGAPPKNSNVSAIRPQSERPGPGGPKVVGRPGTRTPEFVRTRSPTPWNPHRKSVFRMS